MPQSCNLPVQVYITSDNQPVDSGLVISHIFVKSYFNDLFNDNVLHVVYNKDMKRDLTLSNESVDQKRL